MNWYKKAWDLPGDPNLPSGVTNQMISRQFDSPDPDKASKQEGETELTVDWLSLGQLWLEYNGLPLPDLYSKRPAPSTLLIKYVYDYDYNENLASNVQILYAKDYEAKKNISWRELLDFIRDYYDDEIKADIERQQEDAKIERQPGYNPLEE